MVLLIESISGLYHLVKTAGRQPASVSTGALVDGSIFMEMSIVALQVSAIA